MDCTSLFDNMSRCHLSAIVYLFAGDLVRASSLVSTLESMRDSLFTAPELSGRAVVAAEEWMALCGYLPENKYVFYCTTNI